MTQEFNRILSKLALVDLDLEVSYYRTRKTCDTWLRWSPKVVLYISMSSIYKTSSGELVPIVAERVQGHWSVQKVNECTGRVQHK